MPLGAIIAGVSAVASIASGAMGSSQASKNNRTATKNAEAQQKHNELVAKKTNEHNAEVHETDQANYHAMRDYSYDMSISNWKRGAEIQDYQHLARLKQFEKNVNISTQQLDLNLQGETRAIEAEQASVDEMFLQQQFDRESSLAALKSVYTEGNLSRREQGVKMLGIQSKQRLGAASINNEIDTLMKQGSFDKTNVMVKGLLAEGQAAMGQAGKSKAKRQQSASAALHRGLMELESQLTGKRKAAGIQLAELSAETSLAKTGVGLNLERIANSIDNAEADAEYNNKVMTANMKSFIRQTERNITEIQLQRDNADLTVRANTMIEPEKLSYDPRPINTPERIFVEPMEAIPGFVPQAAQQSVWAPMISGIAKGAGALSGVDPGGGGGGFSYGNTQIGAGGGNVGGIGTLGPNYGISQN